MRAQEIEMRGGSLSAVKEKVEKLVHFNVCMKPGKISMKKPKKNHQGCHVYLQTILNIVRKDKSYNLGYLKQLTQKIMVLQFFSKLWFVCNPCPNSCGFVKYGIS